MNAIGATASPIARELLERIAAPFAIESSISGKSPERRLAVRTEYAIPRLEELKTSLEVSLTRVSGKSDLAKAIRYSLSRWTALTRYTHDGRLEMSNNAAERAMKPPVLGRKNICSAAPMQAVKERLASTPSLAPARSTASIQKPTYRTSSAVSTGLVGHWLAAKIDADETTHRSGVVERVLCTGIT